MGRISTHILDTGRGKPAAGVVVELYRRGSRGEMTLITSARSNADGRTDQPLLSGPDFAPGVYELQFHIGDYFKAVGTATAAPPFLDVVPLRFTVAEANGHYHVPLLCTPWSYSTYRGS